MVDALSQTSLFLAMLVRASNAFPLELAERDRSYHAELLRAVADVAEVRGWGIALTVHMLPVNLSHHHRTLTRPPAGPWSKRKSRCGA